MKTQPSWWIGVQKEGFAAKCCAHYGVNFDNAPTLIVRSEFIKTKGRRSHVLHKQIEDGLAPMSNGVKVARTKHVAAQISQRAMQSGSLLG